MPQVIAFTRAFAHACEHGHSRVLLCDVADKLRDDDSLADSRTAIRTDLTAAREWRNQVQDLDARFQNLRGSRLLCETWRLAVDRRTLSIGRNRDAVVDRITEHIEDAAEGVIPHWHRDRLTRVYARSAACQSIRSAHRQASRPVVADMLLHL